MPLEPAPLPSNIPSNNPLLIHTSEDLAKLSEVHSDFGAENDDETSDNGI